MAGNHERDILSSPHERRLMSKSTSESLREACPGFDPPTEYRPLPQTAPARSRPGSPLHPIADAKNISAASHAVRRRKEHSQSLTHLRRSGTGSSSDGSSLVGQRPSQSLFAGSTSVLSLNQTLIRESAESEERDASADAKFEKLNAELQLERQQREHAQLENQRIQAERDSIHREWIRAADELSELRAARSHKIDDGYIEGIWNVLKYEVKNWAVVYFQGKLRGGLKARRRDETVLGIEQMANITNGRKYLKSASQRPAIVQAVVWTVLLEEVFECPDRNGGFLWAGKDALHLRALRTSHQPRLSSHNIPEDRYREYQAWMSLMTQSLYPGETETVHEEEVSEICDKILKLVGGYICEDTRKTEEELQRIISRSIQLDRDMHGQKALFYCMPGYGVRGRQKDNHPFREETMEKNDMGDASDRVRLFISPILYKRGTADGKGYGTISMLSKSFVTCELPDETETGLSTRGMHQLFDIKVYIKHLKDMWLSQM